MAKYINADALMEKIKKAYPSDKCAQVNMQVLTDNFHAADVRPNVRGEWVYQNGKTVCSVCNDPYGLRYEGENNFCHNCGADNRPRTTSAKMRGEE